MTQKIEKVRKNLYMSTLIADWYEQEAENLGISQSSMMALALQHYIDYKKSLDMSGTLQKIIDMVEVQGELTPEQKEILNED